MPLSYLSDDERDMIRDEKVQLPVTSSRDVWSGRIMTMVEEEAELPNGATILRQFTRHPGAVAVVVLREGEEGPEVLLERQYRHPVGAYLWEIPAGLLDIAGEDPLEAAQRELAEEADLQAGQWDVLIDYFTSPGGSTESLRIYLARDVSETETPFPRIDEEADMQMVWMPLRDAVNKVLMGSIHNPSAVAGILGVDAALRTETLRDVSAPWTR